MIMSTPIVPLLSFFSLKKKKKKHWGTLSIKSCLTDLNTFIKSDKMERKLFSVGKGNFDYRVPRSTLSPVGLVVGVVVFL
jgi:hypothetical protein